MMVALPAVLVSRNTRSELLVMAALPAVLALKNCTLPLLVMVALPAVPVPRKSRRKLLVMAALPAVLVSPNCRMELLLMVALPAVLVPRNCRVAVVGDDARTRSIRYPERAGIDPWSRRYRCWCRQRQRAGRSWSARRSAVSRRRAGMLLVMSSLTAPRASRWLIEAVEVERGAGGDRERAEREAFAAPAVPASPWWRRYRCWCPTASACRSRS